MLPCSDDSGSHAKDEQPIAGIYLDADSKGEKSLFVRICLEDVRYLNSLCDSILTEQFERALKTKLNELIGAGRDQIVVKADKTPVAEAIRADKTHFAAMY